MTTPETDEALRLAQAQLAQVQAALGHWQELGRQFCDERNAARDEATALRSEVERLRGEWITLANSFGIDAPPKTSTAQIATHARYLQEERARLLFESVTLKQQLTAASALAAQRGEELETLRKALQFYADDRNWVHDTVDIGVGEQSIPFSSTIEMSDRGLAAKTALSDAAMKESAK